MQHGLYTESCSRWWWRTPRCLSAASSEAESVTCTGHLTLGNLSHQWVPDRRDAGLAGGLSAAPSRMGIARGVLAGDGCIPPVGCCRVSSAVLHRVIYHTAVNHAGACVPMNRKVNLWAESHASGFGLRKTVHCFTLHLSLQTVLLDDFSQDLSFSWIFV